MGSFFGKALQKLQGLDEMGVLMNGLDAAGKTTMLYQLKLGEIVTTIPTIGFNVETVEYGNITFTCWDVGGRDKIRPLWRHFYQGTVGIIFVVDSNDKERIDDASGCDNSAKEELHRTLAEDELRDAILLVYANKQDLPNAMSVNEVTARLGLNELRNRIWHIEGSCATTGDGLYEGLDWLSNELKKHPELLSSKVGRAWTSYKDGQDKGRDKRRRKQQEERERNEKQRRDIIESNQKSILVVSGYIREFYEIEANKKMMTFIAVSITKYIHLMYHDPYYHCNQSYKYYGEYTISKHVEFDTNHLNIEQQVTLNQFLDRMEDMNYIHDDGEFIKKYIESKGKLNNNEEKWNHYDFMRFIWISFTKYQRARNEGTEDDKNKNKTIRQLGMKDIWEYTPYSTTKTYVWAQLIFYGLKVDKSFTKLSSANFNHFLVENPSLSNDYKTLINNYYSKQLIKEMESEEKKNEMILPDIMALPSLITNIEEIKENEDIKSNIKQYKNVILKDSVFIEQFENKTFKSWDNHNSFLRVIWCYLNDSGMNDENIMTKWMIFKGKDNYNKTRTNFWIQIMKYYLMKYKQYIDNKDEMIKMEKKSNDKDDDEMNEEKQNIINTMNTWSFEGFLYFCLWKEYEIENDSLFLKYYTEDSIESDKASKQIIDPNKKPLPK